MDIAKDNRRPSAPDGHAASADQATTRAVQMALRIQSGSGTISAVEYLKTQNVDSAVISRVLTSAMVRGGDLAF